MEKREQRHEPVFKAAVEVHNQEECDALKELCIKYSLPIWEDDCAFDMVEYDEVHLFYKNVSHDEDDDWCFLIDIMEDEDINIVTVEEFEELADQFNPQYKSVDDILSKMKELNNQLNKTP